MPTPDTRSDQLSGRQAGARAAPAPAEASRKRQSSDGREPKSDGDRIFSRLAQAWRQHWARILAADAADQQPEPELPATAFVCHPAGLVGPADQTGPANRARSARISPRSG